MAIESTPAGIIITGPDINTAALITLAHALAMEINYGMKMSRIGGLQGAKNLGVIPAGKRGNKKQALKLTVEKIREARPEYEPNGNVAKALAA